MINIYELTYNALMNLGYPVREHGTYSNDEKLPDTFITYQVINSPNSSYADNKASSITFLVQVNLYSKEPGIKQDAINSFKSVLGPAGFFSNGNGRDLPFNKKTHHYGYTNDYKYYESEV